MILNTIANLIPVVLIAGIVVTGLATLYGRTRVERRSGPLLVRLRRNKLHRWHLAWQISLPLLFAGSAAITVADGMEWRSLLTTIGFGLFTIQAMVYRRRGLGPANVELREQGVVTSGAVFTPWSDVVGYEWNPHATNQLILRCPTNRMLVYVSDDLRTKTETILAEHVSVAANRAAAAVAVG